MKRIIVSLLCLLLLLALILPCGALSLITHVRFTYLGYQTLIIGEDDAPENFIHYQQVKSLGSFRAFYCVAGLRSYTYTLKDPANFALKLRVSHLGRFDYFVPDVMYTVSDLAAEGDFRHLAPDVVVENDHGGSTCGIIEYENIQYRYYNDELASILWEWNDVCFQLSASKENVSVTETYPVEKNSVMARLLHSETAADALQTLQAEMEESADQYRIEAIRTRWLIALVVLGELVLIAVTAIVSSLITRKVMKEKAKSSPNLANNDTGESVAESTPSETPPAPDDPPTPPDN